MQHVRWGIVSTGRIAHQFAHDFAHVHNGVLHAVSSRQQVAADQFAAQYGIPKAYADYHAMLNDRELDAVYIATPHNNHFQNSADAIAAGKAVLCEKPLTVNESECRELIRLAECAGTYVMEAMWTWFLPAIRKAKEWVDDGRIGAIRHIKADFGYPLPYDPARREYCVDNAGGCLLEMGIYPVALACLFLAEYPDRMHSIIRTAANGVEDDVTTLWHYPATTVCLGTSFRAKLQNWAYIIGERGYITIPNFWRASDCYLYELDTLMDQYSDGRTSLGFNYEASAVAEDILQGRTQSAIMPHSSSLRFQRLMAGIRSSTIREVEN